MNAEEFIKQPLISYLGNKRKLIHVISDAIETINPRTAADAFSGSGVVSRALLTKCSDKVYVNDFEKYCETMSQCFLCTPSAEDQRTIEEHITAMNACPDATGVVSDLYAPRNSSNVQPGERMFYTAENAARLDGMIAYVSQNVPRRLWPYCLAPVLIQASIRCNTSGVFNAFHKAWGGLKTEGRAPKVKRIVGRIEISPPKWYVNAPPVDVHCEDAFEFIQKLPDTLDLIYLDPPYNKHTYGSNYFMLNVILDAVDGKRPETISDVSGIPSNWKRSVYYKKREMRGEMERLLDVATRKARNVLVSFSDEGFITPDEWVEILNKSGREWRVIETDYRRYGGGRVTESLYMISQKRA